MSKTFYKFKQEHGICKITWHCGDGCLPTSGRQVRRQLVGQRVHRRHVLRGAVEGNLALARVAVHQLLQRLRDLAEAHGQLENAALSGVTLHLPALRGDGLAGGRGC